jgi:GNAT superfamily N-acetyltransferase
MRGLVDYYPVEINKNHYFKKFINLPWEIYRRNAYWVPPLKVDIKRTLDRKRNPFFEYGRAKFFGIVDGKKKMVGRIAAIINPQHNERYHDKAGFFGFFECINNLEVARILFETVTQELKKYNCDRILGPVNYTTNEESGILVEGFDYRPAFMTNYSPPYYDKMLLTCGLEKEIDMFSYAWSFDHPYPQRFTKLVSFIKKKGRFHIRPINRKILEKELEKIKKIYNTSFEGVWGFVPLTNREIEEMGKALKWIADDDLIIFAEYGGKTIGFCLTIPDINEVLKKMNGRLLPFGFFKLLLMKNRIRTARCMVLCTLPGYRIKGVTALMIHHIHGVGVRKGYKIAEMSFIFESNFRMINTLDSLGFSKIKRYRIYKKMIIT